MLFNKQTNKIIKKTTLLYQFSLGLPLSHCLFSIYKFKCHFGIFRLCFRSKFEIGRKGKNVNLIVQGVCYIKIVLFYSIFWYKYSKTSIMFHRLIIKCNFQDNLQLKRCGNIWKDTEDKQDKQNLWFWLKYYISSLYENNSLLISCSWSGFLILSSYGTLKI